MAQAPAAGAGQPAPGEPDPSMDDILASIRRILSDEEKTAKPEAANVLMLDPSMMVEAPERSETPADPAAASEPTLALSEPAAPSETGQSTMAMNDPHFPMADTEAGAPELVQSEAAPLAPVRLPQDAMLVAPEAAAAAAQSVGTLVRKLAIERTASVGRGGLTIEDIVREEIRPLLKAWLDAHLPAVVERSVQAEIERVVGRMTG